MTPIQQLMLGVGAKKKVFLDDVFSTWTYKPTGAWNHAINNGIDLSGEGGMVWSKSRSHTYPHALIDTVRGKTKFLQSNATTAETTDTNAITSFSSTGYEVGADGVNGIVNYVSSDSTAYASWTFRKAPGFFDVKTFTWNGSSGGYTTLAVNHDLGSVPGMVMIKGTNGQDNWKVYHRDLGTGDNKMLALNTTAAAHGMNTSPNNNHFVSVTDTAVTFKSLTNTRSYVMYVFAGGESSAAAATSVDFDGTGDYLTSGSSTDYAMGTGDFTVEGWFKINSGTNYGLFMNHSSGLTNSYGVTTWYYTDYGLTFKGSSGSSHQTGIHPEIGQWFHLALVRNSGTTSFYYNGTFIKSASDTTDYTGERFVIGGYESATYVMNGSVSNFRVVKGTAVYTSSFRPPTEPLTSITNTKLLCCQSSTVEGCTTGTVSESGNPTASTDSPFDDPAGFVFGGNQNVIKTGSYVGNGSSTGPEINLGWEPQWVMWKNSGATGRWFMVDSMRGITTGGQDATLKAEITNAEYDQSDGTYIDLTSTGFKINGTTHANTNANNNDYIYIAIRRSDPLVQKPQLATDVFAMDVGSNSSTIPAADSNFPVDFGMIKLFASSQGWYTGSRLTGDKVVFPDDTQAESTNSILVWDSNKGFWKQIQSTYQAWMWKRHAGFDVVTYKGDGTAGHQISHSLSKVPEMIWVKRRDSTRTWGVYHKGLNGGTNPEQYALYLDTNSANGGTSQWNNTAPTSTHFSLGTSTTSNNSSGSYMAMLFASVNGISKVGSYTGNGTTGQTITTGFQPRFLLIKNTSNANNWFILDTLRGWGSGNDNYLQLDKTDQQYAYNFGEPTSTGFSLTQGDIGSNQNGDNYIYYAHA